MIFEGSLYKWTNLLQGWQYRYVHLDTHQGLLIYYTSKENLSKGEQRGVVLLDGAHLGIDCEGDSTFIIRSHGKTFYFQARDAVEREKWLSYLEKAIHLTTIKTKKNLPLIRKDSLQGRINDADQRLQVFIDQVTELQLYREEKQDQQCYKNLILSAQKLVETVKYSTAILHYNQLKNFAMTTPSDSSDPNSQCPVSTTTCPESNSDDEFENADETDFHLRTIPANPESSSEDEPNEVTNPPESNGISWENYEAAYEAEPEEDLAQIDGSVISHLISQARLSMDLTKITLPTFILERRSFLEMLADFLAHPDEFVNITNFPTPQERFIQVVKWYLSAFHAGRKSPVAKKPYNPILGETFQCVYDLGSTTDKDPVKDGPISWASADQVTFLAEQTSHHPPIASFYAECPSKRIQIDGCLYTKSRFLGLSVGVHMIGDATLTLIDHDESYVITFPSAYGRGILSVPWFEMGGRVSIECAKSGYSATIEFLTKGFINGKKHQITGTIFTPEKRELAKINGEWNGVMNIRYVETNTIEPFFDTTMAPIYRKSVRPLVEQGEYESRRLWKDVTYYLKSKQMNKATEAKSFLEHRQRQEAKERAERNEKWQTKFFIPSGEQKWTYTKKLAQRLSECS